MSDFNENSGVPTPPMGAAQSPFAAPAPPALPTYSTPGYPAVGGMPTAKPPRPAVTVGAGLLVLGAVLIIAGSFLTWFTILGESYTGFSDGDGGTKDGPVFVFLAVVLLAFGIAQLAARKVLAVGILAILFAVFALLAALADIGDVRDAMDLAESFDVDASSGPGLWVILIGSLIAMAGAIGTVAKRRV